MPILHYLQAVTIEVNMAVEIHFEERPHRDLVLAAILEAISLLMEREVVLDGTARISSLFILAGSES
jgi:hypothetical protein